MSVPSASIDFPTGEYMRGADDDRLRGRWLAIARIAWIVAALLILLLDILGTPVLFQQMHTGCDGDQCLNLQLSTAQMASLVEIGMSRAFIATYITALYWTGTLIYAIIGAIIFWRRSDDRMALFGSFTLIAFGAGPVFGAIKALPTSNPSWRVAYFLVELVGTVSFYVFFCIFPSGHFVPHWMRWAAIVVAAGELLAPIPSAPVQAVLNSGIDFIVLWALLVFAQAYRYWRVSSLVQRQQTKWVVLGFVAGLGGFLVFLGFVNIALSPSWTSTPAGVLLIDAALSAPLWIIPIFIGIAILRSRLWDIDVVINRTLVYGSLTALLAAIYFAGVVGAQALLNALAGQPKQDSPIVIVATTLLIAALFMPLRRHIQATIDHRFYRRKYDAARTLERFAATLRSETDLEELRAHLVTVVQATMQPAHVSLWLRPQDRRRDV